MGGTEVVSQIVTSAEGVRAPQAADGSRQTGAQRTEYEEVAWTQIA